ncbi:hypothetical protein BDV93DRAFT_606750 [Ceratobasidium sp. AG-I]|nr:hypothetical protein BDV93DRAFT_606750 [Ceratobasidium sp. AG-I]
MPGPPSNLLPNLPSKEPAKTSPVARFFLKLLWYTGCFITLGYAPKYYHKILKWQVYDLSKKDKNHIAYSEDFNSKKLGLDTSVRAKQQREWDRLIMPLSVITATSAAALAIPSPFGTPNIYWLATAFYSVAFGLSLEGLIIITYLTVFGAGTSAETIGRIASGKAFLHGMVGPVAIVTALPTAITTYSSFFLLAGLLAMTIAADSGSSIRAHMGAYQAIVLVPVCVMLLCLIVTILGCEAFGWIETRAKEKRTVAAGIEEGSRVASGVVLGAQKQEA